MHYLKKLTLIALMMSWAIPSLAEDSSKEKSAELESAEAETTLTEKQQAEQWAYDFMAAKVPPGTKIYYPDGEETSEETITRYRSIAKDIVEVVFDPQTTVPYPGARGRTRTAAVLLGIMFHESSFMKHVDYGLGKYARGDNGRSWCMMQLKLETGRTIRWNKKHDRRVHWGDPEEEIFNGYDGEELIAERKRCIQEGLKLVRTSVYTCRHLPVLDTLAAYASGSCNDGFSESRSRMGTAVRWFHSTRKQQQGFTEKTLMVAVANDRKKQEALREAKERQQQKAKDKEDRSKVAQKNPLPNES